MEVLINDTPGTPWEDLLNQVLADGSEEMSEPNGVTCHSFAEGEGSTMTILRTLT